MKGPVSAMITAFEKIAQMNDRMYSPVLLLTSDEEARDFAGIKKILRGKQDENRFWDMWGANRF